MESQRYLRCLGQPALFAANGEPIRFRTRKHLALLVYLAVENRSHRRDRLAELLWPVVSATEARHSLATALSVLRPRLGLDGLESSRDHVRIAPGRVVLDLERLQAGDVLGSEVSEPLQVAAFLDGFDILDSVEFTQWKDQQQARLLPVIKDALLVLIDRCRRTGDTRQIEQVADRMLALDDLCEEAIRAKMEARAFAGDRLTALEIFEAWKKKLAEELQALPSDLVEGMAVRLRRRGWERTTLANVPNVPTDQWRGRPFVGRAAEYRTLYERWEEAKKGVARHVLITGDSGVGKTTLVQRLTTAAGLEGAGISRVQCYDLEREIPYSTLNGLVLGLLDRPGVSATSPAALGELSRTIPEVHRRFPCIPVPTDSQGETARIRLTEAFLEMLSAVAEEHPVVLVLDDLHLADDVSLAVLHLVMRRVRAKPIMVVLVARSGELRHSSQARHLQESASALGIRELDLAPLSGAESCQMLDSLLEPDGAQPTAPERRALLCASAGYPMVLELLLQDWKVSREKSLALSLDAMTTDLEEGGAAHLSYSHILDRLTSSLDRTTQNVLNLAAILGRRLNDVGMYALVDLSAGQTIAAMADLVARRVLRDGAQGLEFVNELVRAAAYVALPATLRRLLHSKIADRLIQQLDGSRDEQGLEIAWHSIRAGRLEEATPHLLSGARASIRVGALHSAESALSTAIPHLSAQERSEAALLLIEVLQEQGRWRDSLDALREWANNLSPEAVTVHSIQARHSLYGSTTEELYEHIQLLRPVIESMSDPHLRLRAARIAASMNMYLRDPQTARTLLNSLSTIPTPVQFDDVARLSDCKAHLLYHAHDFPAALKELVHLTRSISEERGINSTAGSVHTGLGVLACSEGDYRKGKAAFIRGHDVYVRLGNDYAAGNSAAQVALACLRVGEYQEGIIWTGHAYRVCRHFEVGGFLECQTARSSGTCQALLGRTREAREAIDSTDVRISENAPRWVKQFWQLAKADILLYLGARSEARAVGEGAIGYDGLTLYDSGHAGAFARWVALTMQGTPREAQAKVELESLRREMEQFDALDQVEVLCALSMLSNGESREHLCEAIYNRLTRLPLAVSQQLTRLGALNLTHSQLSRFPFAEV